MENTAHFKARSLGWLTERRIAFEKERPDNDLRYRTTYYVFTRPICLTSIERPSASSRLSRASGTTASPSIVGRIQANPPQRIDRHSRTRSHSALNGIPTNSAMNSLVEKWTSANLRMTNSR